MRQGRREGRLFHSGPEGTADAAENSVPRGARQAGSSEGALSRAWGAEATLPTRAQQSGPQAFVALRGLSAH